MQEGKIFSELVGKICFAGSRDASYQKEITFLQHVSDSLVLGKATGHNSKQNLGTLQTR
jgi:hypothetical protein